MREQLGPRGGGAGGRAAGRVDGYGDEGAGEGEEGARGFEAVGCGAGAVYAAGAVGREEVHAFRVVVGGYHGEHVDECAGVGWAGLLVGRRVAEEEGDGVRVG